MTRLTNERNEILREAVGVLLEHMEPARFARLAQLHAAQVWVASQPEGGDYLAIRDQLFVDETVTTLVEKTEAYQAG